MTYQRDPERPTTTPLTPEEIARRQEEAQIALHNDAARSTGIMPILLTVLVLLGVGYFAYSRLSAPNPPNAPHTTENSAPRTVTPDPTPAVPTAPQTK